MITLTGDTTKIDIEEKKLFKSMAVLMDLRDFFEENKKEEGTSETEEALQCAVETMFAFAAEHFSGGE